jgi:hypothetical protein
MREPKPAPNQTTVAEEFFDLFRMGVGRDIKILGLAAEQQITYTAADQIGLIAAVFKSVEDLECVFTDPGA